jgi:hypothetical protein
LPEYIALRFNLAIREVYRGLLLGTGPLVDPGFTGRLSFPLHNLTNETYCFRAGEEVVWIEFTKLSTWKGWASSTEEKARNGNFYNFQEEKRSRKDIDDYLYRANAGRPVRSSIPIEIKSASDRAKDASDHALAAKTNLDALAKNIRGYSIVGLIVLGVSLAALVVEMLSHSEHVLMTTQSMINGARTETQTVVHSAQSELRSMTESNAAFNEDLTKQIQATKSEDAELKKATEDLAAKIQILEGEIGDLEKRPPSPGR